MKNYWILTRVMLKNMMSSLNPFASIYETRQKKSRAILKAALLLIVMLGALASVVYLEYLIFTGLNKIRMKELLPGLAIMVSMLLTLVLGLFQGLSELFQGKDAPFLAVLPLTSRQIFAARLTTLYLTECEVNAVICIPAFVLYAVSCGSAWPVALTGLPVLLLLPVIPLSIVALIASLLMRISAFARHRETIVMALSMALAIAYSAGVTMTSGSSSSPDEVIQMLMSREALMHRLTGFFPPVEWAMKGLTGNWAMLLLLVAVSAACAAAVLAIAGPGYLNQALSSTEKTVVRSKREKGEYAWNRHSILAALHGLEWKELMRTPAWAYNALAGVIMFPLMITIGMMTGISNADSSGLEGFRQLIAGLDQGYVAVVTAGILMFGSMVNPAVSTAISREGGRWPFALTLPVQQKTRFLAKLLVGVEINLAAWRAADFLADQPRRRRHLPVGGRRPSPAELELRNGSDQEELQSGVRHDAVGGAGGAVRDSGGGALGAWRRRRAGRCRQRGPGGGGGQPAAPVPAGGEARGPEGVRSIKIPAVQANRRDNCF